MWLSEIVEKQALIFGVFGLQRADKFEQTPIDDHKINVSAEDDAPMLPAIGLVMRMDTLKIFFVDGDHGAVLQNGKLHLRIIILCIHAGFMRAYGINSDRAQAPSYFIGEVLIQVQFDFQAATPIRRLARHHKPVRWLA